MARALSLDASAVVARDVTPCAVVGGGPARPIHDRFPAVTAARFRALAWWDGPHAALHAALDDFRRLGAKQFLDRNESRAAGAEAS